MVEVMIIGSISIIDHKVYVEGKQTTNPEHIGLALLDSLESMEKPNYEVMIERLNSYLCREYGKSRIGPERKALLKVILKLKVPFTAKDVHDELNDNNFELSHGTIYNSLNLFAKCKIVQRVVVEPYIPKTAQYQII